MLPTLKCSCWKAVGGGGIPQRHFFKVLGGGSGGPPRDSFEVLGGGSRPPKDSFEVLGGGGAQTPQTLIFDTEGGVKTDTEGEVQAN